MLSLIFNPLPLVFRPVLAQEDTGTSFNYSYQSNHVSPVIWVIEAVIFVVVIASMWKIFTKAGQPGWASIIPIYNWIVWCKIVGRPAWWVLLLLLCFPIFFIILCIDLAKSFGQGVGFAIGLILLGIIFFPILAFGNAQYRGPAAGGVTPPAPA